MLNTCLDLLAGLPHVMVNIFLNLEPCDLHNCRQVCKDWNTVIRLEVWQRKCTRNILEERLLNRWQQSQYKRSRFCISDYGIPPPVGIKVTDNYIILHTQVHRNVSGPLVMSVDIKTGEKIKEKSLMFKHGLGEASGNDSFLVFRDNLSHSVDLKENYETIQILSVPDLATLDVLEFGETPRIYSVGPNAILFLSPFKHSLDYSEFIEYRPLSRIKNKFKVRLSFYDALSLSFDGTFACVKTIGQPDMTHVFNIKSRHSVLRGASAGMFGLCEQFEYPLLLNIRDHCELAVVNLEDSERVNKHFFQKLLLSSLRSDDSKPEVGLGNKMIFGVGLVLLTRYSKYSLDHTDCISAVDVFKVEDLKAGNFESSEIRLSEGGPLFDEICATKTCLGVVNNQTKTLDILRFWS